MNKNQELQLESKLPTREGASAFKMMPGSRCPLPSGPGPPHHQVPWVVCWLESEWMLSFRINSSLEKMLRESGWGRKDRIRGYLSSLVQFKTHCLKYLLCLEYCGRALGNLTFFSVSIFPPLPLTLFLHLFLLLSSFLPPSLPLLPLLQYVSHAFPWTLFSNCPWWFWSSPNTHYTINDYSPLFFGDKMRWTNCDCCLLVLSNLGKWFGPVLQEVDYTYWERRVNMWCLSDSWQSLCLPRGYAILIRPFRESLPLLLPQMGW